MPNILLDEMPHWENWASYIGFFLNKTFNLANSDIYQFITPTIDKEVIIHNSSVWLYSYYNLLLWDYNFFFVANYETIIKGSDFFFFFFFGLSGSCIWQLLVAAWRWAMGFLTSTIFAHKMHISGHKNGTFATCLWSISLFFPVMLLTLLYYPYNTPLMM